MPQARTLAKVAAASSLESAAKLLNMQVGSTKHSRPRDRGAKMGARRPRRRAASLPHTVSEPIRSTAEVVVERVRQYAFPRASGVRVPEGHVRAQALRR